MEFSDVWIGAIPNEIRVPAVNLLIRLVVSPLLSYTGGSAFHVGQMRYHNHSPVRPIYVSQGSHCLLCRRATYVT